jgi:hypothetical protein
MKQPIYSFSAVVRGEDGTEHPFHVEIAAPEDTGEGDSVCMVSCPFLRAKPFSIFGVDHAQAVELSRRFIEINLEHLAGHLVDADGAPVELPPVPAASTGSP